MTTIMNDSSGEQLDERKKHKENEELAKDNLRDDLTRVLQYGFNFKGDYATSLRFQCTPNPWLYIDGIGTVGLPLSDRDANLIANLEPSTASEGTNLQGITLIDPSKISFKNPDWFPYVYDEIFEKVWKKLGCHTRKTGGCFEFRKLLLQKSGSRFFSPADAEPSPRRFGTVIIVLPSEFTGGGIRVSYNTISVLTSDHSSRYGTSALAWYTDTDYEGEVIKSGWRLALVYDILHTSAGTLSIPNPETLSKCAREVFRKWVSSGYEGVPDDHVAVYVPELGVGGNTLLALGEAAMAEDMTLLMGELYVHVTGWRGDSVGEKPPYGLTQETFANLVMEKLYIAKFKAKRFTDINGKPLCNKFKLILYEDNLIPEFPFKGVKPDCQDAHFTTGDDQSHVPLEYWYERPVLVLFPSWKQLDVLLASGGVEYALTELEKSASEGPTKENRKITEFIFQNWHKTPPEFDLFDFRPGYQVPTMTPRETAIGLIKIAIKSDDAGLWVRTMDMCKFEDEIDLNRFGLEYIVAGWEKFKLEDIEAALDRIMNGLPTVEGSLTVIKAFQNSKNVLHPETRRDEWFSAHLDRSFSKKVDGSALSLIMEVACSKGLDYMSRVVIPPLLANPLEAYDCSNFVALVRGSRDRLLAFPPSHGQTTSNQELFDNILDDLLRVITMSGRRIPGMDVDSEDAYDSEDDLN